MQRFSPDGKVLSNLLLSSLRNPERWHRHFLCIPGNHWWKTAMSKICPVWVKNTHTHALTILDWALIPCQTAVPPLCCLNHVGGEFPITPALWWFHPHGIRVCCTELTQGPAGLLESITSCQQWCVSEFILRQVPSFRGCCKHRASEDTIKTSGVCLSKAVVCRINKTKKVWVCSFKSFGSRPWGLKCVFVWLSF